MEGLTKKYDTSPESWVPGAKPGVGFMLIASVLCLPSQFENCTFCRAEYSEILPFYAIWQKIGMSCKLSGKTKFSMATCRLYMSWPLFTAKFHIFTFTTNLNLFLALSVNFRIFWWFYVSLYQILALDLDDTRNIIGHAKLFFPRYCFYYLFITTVNSSLTRNIFYVARELFSLSLKE